MVYEFHSWLEFIYRNMFQIHTINLSVAVWVGFIALFGIATDDGVLISTYLKQLFDKKAPKSLRKFVQMFWRPD